jgi:hypothetical protein
MKKVFKQICRQTFILALFIGAEHREACSQETCTLFPSRSLFPELLAGPRDPTTSFSVLGVTENPNAHGSGVEVEVSIGTALPVLLLLGEPGRTPVVAGIEAAAFARFGLQILERELIATDWVFAVPVYWLRETGWLRFRYLHTSSHMGDEYARRFDDPGINFARDAAEIFAFHNLSHRWGVYGGLRYAYIIHPEESKRWVLRAGAQGEAEETGSFFRPFAAWDVEWDQEAGDPRIEVDAGVWLPKAGDRRSLRIFLTFLTGPSPLGQFNGRSTTQLGLRLQANR